MSGTASCAPCQTEFPQPRAENVEHPHPRNSQERAKSYNKLMLTAYIQAALRHAKYEMIEDRQPFYGHIPECPGVWAAGATLEDCREELQSVLEDWIVLGLRLGHPIPVIDGIAVAPEKLEAIDV